MIEQESPVRYADVVRALGINVRKAENWQTRKILPIQLVPPKRHGFAARVNIRDIEALSLWLIVAAIIGPKRAYEFWEFQSDRSPTKIDLQVGCVSFSVDLRPMREAIWPLIDPHHISKRAA